MTIEWQHLFDRLPFQLIKREGFSIKLYAHSGFLRYSEPNRDLTLVYKTSDETGQIRRLLGFSARSTVLYVPSALKWDGGTALDQDESTTVVRRICETLQGRKGRCNITIDDGMYEKMQHDANAAAKAFSEKK
jgi:hypothetical protein